MLFKSRRKEFSDPTFSDLNTKLQSFGHIFVNEEMLMSRRASVMFMYTIVLCEHYTECL